MHLAFAAKRYEVWLLGAPARETSRPFLGPSQVEHLMAEIDDRTVHDARDDRRHLACFNRDHDFVQAGHALSRRAALDAA